MFNLNKVEMKKFIVALALSLPLFFTSCVQDDEYDNVYYVRYEAHIDKPEDGIFQVVFTMSDGGEEKLKFSDQGDFSVVIGPVKYGFDAKIYANCIGGTGFKGAYTRILVSKNNEPFALKSFHGGENYLESLSGYAIAY